MVCNIHTTRLAMRDYSEIRSYRLSSRSTLYNIGHYKNTIKYLSFYRPPLLRQTDDRNMTWMYSGEIALHHNPSFRSLRRSYYLRVLDASQHYNEPKRYHETSKNKINLRTTYTTAKVWNDDKCRSYQSTPAVTFWNISPISEILRHNLLSSRK